MINIDWSTTLFQILNFAVMAFILYKVFFKPVLKVLDERSEKVNYALDEAAKREKAAQEMHDAYEQKLIDANELVIGMKQQAQDDLEQTKQQFIAEAQQEIQQMRDKSHKEIAQARSQAIHQHRLELGQLVTILSARLIREAGGETFQKAAMEEFMVRLESLPADQYQKMFLHVEDESVNIQLVSANELNAGMVSRVKEQIQALIDHPVEVKHKVNPDLIAGATVRFGDVMIDGSLEGQLDSLRTQYIHELEQVVE